MKREPPPQSQAEQVDTWRRGPVAQKPAEPVKEPPREETKSTTLKSDETGNWRSARVVPKPVEEKPAVEPANAWRIASVSLCF